MPCSIQRQNTVLCEGSLMCVCGRVWGKAIAWHYFQDEDLALQTFRPYPCGVSASSYFWCTACQIIGTVCTSIKIIVNIYQLSAPPVSIVDLVALQSHFWQQHVRWPLFCWLQIQMGQIQQTSGRGALGTAGFLVQYLWAWLFQQWLCLSATYIHVSVTTTSTFMWDYSVWTPPTCLCEITCGHQHLETVAENTMHNTTHAYASAPVLRPSLSFLVQSNASLGKTITSWPIKVQQSLSVLELVPIQLILSRHV